MNFEAKLDQFNSKTLLNDCHKKQATNMDELLQAKRQLDQIKIQRERDETIFKQQLERRDREFEFRFKEVKEREHKQYEIEAQLLREDFTYKLHLIEQEKNTQVRQLQDTVSGLEEMMTQAQSQNLERLQEQEFEAVNKFNLRCEQHQIERKSDLDNYNLERYNMQSKYEQETENKLSRGKQDKDKSLYLMEESKNLEVFIVNIIEIAQIQLKFEQRIRKQEDDNLDILKNMKNDAESLRQLFKDQIDAEKANTNLFRRRAQDVKKTCDQDIDTMNQEYSIIITQKRQEVQDEKSKTEKMQIQYDQNTYESVCRETKLIEESTQREDSLRLRLQNQINDMYQRQIEVAQALDKQYRDLDLAAERKYDKLNQNYQGLQKLFSENLDRNQVDSKKINLPKRNSLRRTLKENCDEGGHDGYLEVLNVLTNVNVQRSSTVNNKKRIV